MNRFIHFELATDDIEKSVQFYQDVFGWQIQKWEGPIDYWLVTTGDENSPGINGGLMQANGKLRGTINTIGVEDIEAAIAQIQVHGGEIMFPKDSIPGVGYQAYFKDSNGTIVGLHQGDPKAGMEG
jgi:predicted enzyme related to lactoylglutathione lyase